MSFRINTNINAMNSHANAVGNNRNLSNSLGRLSSGLRIQTAADDASGLAIADSLRSQASALGQAIANGNDAIGIIQVADKAMDEQLKILDTIKVKATQAAQDGQTTRSRQALQADIVRLMEELDNIGNSTSFNGQQLLNGTFSNKEFQIGAYSNQTVKASIGATTSDKIGLTRFESSKLITGAAGAGGVKTTLTFINVDGINNVKVAGTVLSYGLGTGLGALAENINKVADQTGVRASFDVTIIAEKAITAGSIVSLSINGVKIGDLEVKANDSNGTLVNAINSVKDQTGVEASIDPQGKLRLTSREGRGILISGGNGTDKAIGKALGVSEKIDLSKNMFLGRLNLVRLDGRDIKISSGGNANGSFSTAFTAADNKDGGNQASVSLREIKGQIASNTAAAMGFQRMTRAAMTSAQAAGVMTLRGAMAVMDIAESAQRTLDFIRSDLGSVQNQLVATVNNITVTQVNVKSAESQIRDVDFAAESANFSKYNILAQSGSYAMSQANSVQQNVLKLLQ
ncbi:flagellin B [Campylobacter pinnipediorum subsp. pinnipediorum]|uniref:Flagellin n=1 Tax=Campylobacter pinnipediorum subsp. pinnipediorum TaxID=1660067 RepID=A0AAX0L918_9BACT|nr:flagellin B [Campylobacter pinnipediorum]OPA75832.1 flagellin B [Campylobacter pinnipediorum subsp. pinnipediorum]